jgi:hypothetical protein
VDYLERRCRRVRTAGDCPHHAGVKNKTARITVETERLLVISRSQRMVEYWCCHCDANVKIVGVEEAALIAGASERTIFRWAETAEIHFIETEAGKAMFCVDSLLRQTDPRARKSPALVENKKE